MGYPDMEELNRRRANKIATERLNIMIKEYEKEGDVLHSSFTGREDRDLGYFYVSESEDYQGWDSYEVTEKRVTGYEGSAYEGHINLETRTKDVKHTEWTPVIRTETVEDYIKVVKQGTGKVVREKENEFATNSRVYYEIKDGAKLEGVSWLNTFFYNFSLVMLFLSTFLMIFFDGVINNLPIIIRRYPNEHIATKIFCIPEMLLYDLSPNLVEGIFKASFLQYVVYALVLFFSISSLVFRSRLKKYYGANENPPSYAYAKHGSIIGFVYLALAIVKTILYKEGIFDEGSLSTIILVFLFIPRWITFTWGTIEFIKSFIRLFTNKIKNDLDYLVGARAEFISSGKMDKMKNLLADIRSYTVKV